MSMEGGIAYLQTHVKLLTGKDQSGRSVAVRDAPDQPSESANMFPFAVTYEREGDTLLSGEEFGPDTGVIYCEIHVARVFLDAAIVLATSFKLAFLQLIVSDPTLGRNVSPITRVHRTFGEMIWGKVPTIGYRFELYLPSLVTATDVS